MPIIRTWTAQQEHGVHKITVNFECLYFNEFLMANGGMLSRDFEAHALFDYYGCALIAHDRAKNNLVLETDLSLKFDVATARQLFQSKANQHGVRPDNMVRFWPMIMRQQIAMGGTDHLPEIYKFRYWGN
jgi:hypothetical protein